MSKILIPAAAASAILASAPAALAAAPGAALARPAGQATPASTATPALGPWTKYYPATDSPSKKACQSFGVWLEQNKNIDTYECLEYEFDGYTTVWDLWFRIF